MTLISNTEDIIIKNWGHIHRDNAAFFICGCCCIRVFVYWHLSKSDERNVVVLARAAWEVICSRNLAHDAVTLKNEFVTRHLLRSCVRLGRLCSPDGSHMVR